ncbi:hypothetical protein Tco_0292315 [Tanacetum coccineum]
MDQYLTNTDYALWEVIMNGDAPAIASASTDGPIPPKTIEQKLARKNELKAKSTLLLADMCENTYLCEYCTNHKKTVKTGQTRTQEWKSTQRAGRKLSKVKSGQLKSTFGQLNFYAGKVGFTVHRLQGLTTKVKLDMGKANTSDKDYSGRVKTSSNASYWSSPLSEDRG